MCVSLFHVLRTVKQYPVIDGISDTVGVTFARFQDTSASGCGYKTAAIGNNPLSPDAVHPLHMEQTNKLSVHQSSLVLFYDPDPAWIVQEVSRAGVDIGIVALKSVGVVYCQYSIHMYLHSLGGQ